MSHPAFRLKFCGLRAPADALAALDAGADAVGLNFYARSPRSVEPARAREIAAAVGSRGLRFGLFVNAAPREIAAVLAQVPLDALQIHGDEPPEFLAELLALHLPVMRAFRLGAAGLPPVLEYLDRCRALGCLPRWVLLDAAQEGSFGGTGRLGNWQAAAAFPRGSLWPQLVLAGGLTADNVAAAIARVQPAAVDVASGIESSPGVKSRERMQQFAHAARAALAHAAEYWPHCGNQG